MPTYEYECRECSYTFEAFQSINDEPLKTCPLCGGSIKRLIGGGSGIIFKGPGFYITDSRKAQSAASTSNKPTSTESSAEKGNVASAAHEGAKPDHNNA